MEISDCIWDEGFPLTVEELGQLEESLSTSIDSPVLVPFQWAGGPPLADEADKADMTPQCMPVIDPNFVRENFIEGCIIDGVSDVISGGDDILTDYLIGQESYDIFRCLHILVCGFCHSVYHTIDEFKSHISTCNGSHGPGNSMNNYETNICDSNINECNSINENSCDTNKSVITTTENNTSCVVTTGLALVLWTSTVMRRVRNSLSVVSPDLQADLSARIQAKWTTLDIQTKQVWEKAAEALQELVKVGSLVFPEQQLPEQHSEQVQLSQQFHDGSCHYMDEIELPTKETNDDCYGKRISNSVSVKKEENKRFSKNPPKHEVSKTNCDKIKINKQNRGRNGRWLKPENEDVNPPEFTCNQCRFSTNNPWKYSRHKETVKHLQLTTNIDKDISNTVEEVEDDNPLDEPTEHLTDDTIETEKEINCAIETENITKSGFDYLPNNMDVNNTLDDTKCNRDSTNNEVMVIEDSFVLQHNHMTAISDINEDVAIKKDMVINSKDTKFSEFIIERKVENNNKEASKLSPDQTSCESEDSSSSLSEAVFNDEISTVSSENDPDYLLFHNQRNYYEESNYNGNNLTGGKYSHGHQILPIASNLCPPPAKESLYLVNGSSMTSSKRTNNVDKSLVTKKQKIKEVELTVIPGKRATSKRSSALTASRRMQDWTSILSKR